MTETTTKTKTNTKLLIATLALAAAGGLAFILLPKLKTSYTLTRLLPLVCSEGDAGKNPQVFSSTTLRDPNNGYKIVASNFDACEVATNTVNPIPFVEFYCDGSSIKKQEYNCAAGCVAPGTCKFSLQ